jgi:hypothetical protein
MAKISHLEGKEAAMEEEEEKGPTTTAMSFLTWRSWTSA